MILNKTRVETSTKISSSAEFFQVEARVAGIETRISDVVAVRNCVLGAIMLA